MLPSMGSTSMPAVVPHFRPDGSRPQFRVTTGAGFGSPSPVIGLPVVVRSAFDAAICAWARVSMFCVARKTAAPRPRMDTWTRDSAMAGSFVRADKTSQDVPRWVRVDQTLFTAAILNLAINARNAMPNGGGARDSSPWKHEIGRKRWRNSRCGGGPDDAHRRCALFAAAPHPNPFPIVRRVQRGEERAR